MPSDPTHGLPILLRRLAELGATDASETQSLLRDGILTLPDLELALAERRPAVSTGALASRLGRAAAALLAEDPLFTLGRAWDLLESLLAAMAEHCPDVEAIEGAGDLRRFEQLVSGISVVARAADPPRAIDAVSRMPAVTSVLHRTGRRVVIMFHNAEVDVRIAMPDEFGSVLFAATGPAAHVADVLRRRGPRLSGSEPDVYKHAGLSYLPPELRHDEEAVRAAQEGRVPALVTREDIRGDLHMHTTYSDGQNPLPEIVAACCALEYEYIAITDHSVSAAAARTVSFDALERQKEEIADMRERFPQIAILHGIEAEILPSGRLDFPDEVLADLDIVLASLHERAGQDGRQLTERCLRAIRHPLVSIITHPANQLVGRRVGYDMDYAVLYAAAAETGTALEIDGAPVHLDLDGAHTRGAVRAGVTLTIDSDCHRARSLDRQMRLGVGTARRGWAQPAHVLNTRPLSGVRAFLSAKRGAP